MHTDCTMYKCSYNIILVTQLYRPIPPLPYDMLYLILIGNKLSMSKRRGGMGLAGQTKLYHYKCVSSVAIWRQNAKCAEGFALCCFHYPLQSESPPSLLYPTHPLHYQCTLRTPSTTHSTSYAAPSVTGVYPLKYLFSHTLIYM